MGPSGTGKTTLLRLISGQIKAGCGPYLDEWQNVPELTRNELYEMRRTMGMLFQSGALLLIVRFMKTLHFHYVNTPTFGKHDS